MKSRVQFKFPTPWKTLIIKFPPPRDGKSVKCPGYARGGGGGMLKLRFDRYISSSKKIKRWCSHDFTRSQTAFVINSSDFLVTLSSWWWERIFKISTAYFCRKKKKRKTGRKKRTKESFRCKIWKGQEEIKDSSMETWQLPTSSYLHNLFLWSTVLAINIF